MTFVDDLGLVEVLLFLAATVLAYAGVVAFWAIRQNRPEDLRRVLRGSAVPIGGIGLSFLLLSVWGEIAWPFPSFMAGYNILFFDPMLLFGIVLLAYSVVALRDLPLQYVGLLALAAGGAAAFYGWTGYTASPAFTKEPFDTFLLYGSFAFAGLATLPATVIADYYLKCAAAGEPAWSGHLARRPVALRALDARGVAPAPGADLPGPNTPTAVTSVVPPAWIQLVLLVLPVAMILAAIASLWFFGTTLPGHLGTGPGGAP